MQIKMGKRMVLCVMVGLLAGLTAVHSSGIVQTIAESRASRTLVIDAGHGGFDGGAVGSNGTAEQDINLSIAQRLYGLAGFFGVQAVMTRPDTNALDYDPSRPVRENKISDIKAREQIVQQAANPIFLSIHLNKFSDPQYHGAQVFYSANHAGGRVLAEYLQNSLIYGCDPENRRQAKQAESSIYLMKKLTCPAVIVECGFLSNAEEEMKLNDPDYHKKLAACILRGYLQYANGD
ncbi:N-acetylmuramoyl-L-alanine amidase [Agathobaculum sp. NSJ-28]|uniref:N-acetylmuramoyl-L-alanine amidase n=2 Tax=Agathobaculum TaxID=2048137 RepID=A0A923RUN2_9FIRM|nr:MULTISPECIES: N-acetylmuramoyl-L-alanine amidase [Butyricicoccaceae]MBS6882076.1 N-acetylmuramoyl-L-alanine amidase [Clostridiaceae bacterium]SCI42942.1 N-acetylmuramoyl-L-alanine amidase AmiA precursor [uncultured Butyricicoccus sp.]MBC5724064.1 N-acetylmuramoyl-L-alanine amidase [Agathobaculum faecis]MCU6787697.1 N-acetylmuramoyl-L-alanine amidase [Agathobaculum ammoniilyticum]WOC73990.1 N-acetylmuramoyl-L-alanine amidase [Intestinibacillus sp. NTUH-41-i26]